MLKATLGALVLCLAGWASVSSAHERHELNPVLGITGTGRGRPWTDQKLLNDPKNFQFAIVSDRTGAHRPGVFGDAVRRLNILQPEFVMSVGDLIEGYTEDPERMKVQWDEFDSLVKKLAVRFFYVPGNHDISNEAMRDMWHARYGSSYYFFVYSNVLFLCINSQDPPIHRIGSEQIEWIGRVLSEHARVRWTLVFLHTPLWHRESDKNGWDKVEALLKDRRHTVFAGHEHHYTKDVRNNRRYFTLATTGGGSKLTGPKFGEFDHVVWVTMRDDAPVIANLMLKGIMDEDLTPDVGSILKRLTDSPPVKLNSAHVGDPAPRKLVAEARLTNGEDVPMEISLAWKKGSGFRMKPRKVKVTVPPNSVEKVKWDLVSRKPIVVSEFGPVVLAYTAVLNIKNLPPIKTEGELTFGFDRTHVCRKITRAPTIDGKVNEWKEFDFDVSKPKAIGMIASAWKGKEDASFKFSVVHDGKFLYVAVAARDDAETAKDRTFWQNDAVLITIDPRSREARDTSAAKGESVGGIVYGSTPDGQMPDYYKATLPAGSKFACVRTREGWSAEFAMPLSNIAGDDFRLNISQIDTDGDEEWGAQVNWRPAWDWPNNYPESGIFRIE